MNKTLLIFCLALAATPAMAIKAYVDPQTDQLVDPENVPDKQLEASDSAARDQKARRVQKQDAEPLKVHEGPDGVSLMEAPDQMKTKIKATVPDDGGSIQIEHGGLNQESTHE